MKKMVKEILVDDKTRWECVSCGKCCHKLGEEISLKLFGENTKNGRCVKLNEKDRCSVYIERPLGCKMYPFYPDWGNLKKGKIDFKFGSVRMDAECSGYGKGSKVVHNHRLFKRLEKISLELRKRIIANPKGKIKDLFSF